MMSRVPEGGASEVRSETIPCEGQAGRYGGSNRHYFFPELAGGPQTVKRRESEKQYLTFAFHSL
jgi:hypothetical protein